MRSDKRHSVFSEVASSLTPILNSPLDVEMPPPVGDAADLVIVDGVVKYASLQALLTILTSSKPNPNIRHLDQLHDAFLLCFRCFSTSTDVANALIARFQQPQPENLTEEQENAWRFHLQAIRLRVVDILRDWVESYWVHEVDRQVAPLMQHFLESTIELRWSDTSKNIAQSLRRHFLISNHPNMHYNNARHLQATNKATLRVRFSERRPSSVNLLDTYATKALPDPPRQKVLKSATSADVLARNEDDLHVLVFNSEKHCTELARQLTLSMSIEFCEVDSEKLWHHFYRQCQDCDTEQTVKILQLHALALQVWTARSVVEQSDPETRTGVLTFFVALAFVSFLSSITLSDPTPSLA
jgi:son of sevenless-like protein